MTGQWYLQRSRSRVLGPFSTEEIVEGIATGEIPLDANVCEVAGKQWVPIGSVDDFEAIVEARRAGRVGPVGGPSPFLRATVRNAPAIAAAEVGLVGAAAARGATPGADASAPAAASTRAVRRHVRLAKRSRAPVAPPREASLVAFTIAGVGLALTLYQLVALAWPTEEQRALFDGFRIVRTETILAASVCAVGYPAILLGASLARRGDPLGAALVRAAAAAMLATAIVFCALAWGALASSPRWGPLVPSARLRLQVGVVAVGIGAAVASATLLALFAHTEPPTGRWWTQQTAPLFLVVCGAGALVGVFVHRFAATRDQVRIVHSGAAPVAVFLDRESLTAWIEGGREGSWGAPKLARAYHQALVVSAGTRARYVDELTLHTSEGDALAREVEILEGEHAGRRVFVPPEMATPRSPTPAASQQEPR